MRRSLVVLVAIVTLPVLLPTEALAKGSWLQPEQRAYAVGDHAVARGTFGGGSLEGEVPDGPFYAYLAAADPKDEFGGPIPDDAVALGEMTITEATGTMCCWVARVAFTVPDVPAGRYTIRYCNDPCTVNGIGDGGSLTIAPTVREAQLTRRVELLQVRVRRFRRSAERYRDESRARGRALAAAEQDARHHRAWAESLQETLAAREAALQNARRPLVSGWGAAAIAGVLALVVLAFVRRRRSRPETPPAMPDIVPPEALEEIVEWVGQVPDRQPTTSSGRPGMVRASPGLSAGSSPVTKS